MSETLVVDDLAFAVRRSARRRTVGITVERDGSLVLAAPAACDRATLERVAREKRFWVYTKLAQKEALFRPRRAKEYVSGEGFFYLGRSYRLQLVTSPAEANRPRALRLHHGRFELLRPEQGRGREHFVAWYREHAAPWMGRRGALLAARLGTAVTPIKVRELSHRWGSCSGSGDVSLHWRAILLPPPIVEYIIAHELVHLFEDSHSPAFWQRLERAMPDFGTRKQWLAEQGANYDL